MKDNMINNAYDYANHTTNHVLNFIMRPAIAEVRFEDIFTRGLSMCALAW